MMRATLGSLTLGLAVMAMPGAALAGVDVQNLRYICDRGVEIPVVYVNADDTSLAVLTVEGSQILLYAEVAASGVKYGWPSGGSHYVWWSKAPEATLSWHDGASDTESTLLSACKIEG